MRARPVHGRALFRAPCQRTEKPESWRKQEEGGRLATQIKAEAVHRDAGLSREIGVWSFAATIINVVVGGGIFAAPAALAGSVGAWAPFALLACGIAMGAI